MQSAAANFDYMEVVFTGPLQAGPGAPRPFVSEAEFQRMLGVMYTSRERPFQADYKEYYLDNLVLSKKIEDGAATESKVYQVFPTTVEDHPHFRVVYYHKKKLTTIAFPSTRSFDAVRHTRRLTFRINNRVYVNFQTSAEAGLPLTSKVYINFNNSKDADLQEAMSCINGVISRLCPSSTTFTQPPAPTSQTS